MDNLTIQQALDMGIQALKNHSDSAKTDAETLLCDVLHCNRTKLIVDANYILTSEQACLWQEYLQQRIQGRPVSYIIGHQDFWTLSLDVNESTLIPRPETELLVELTLDLTVADNSCCLDLGTGTGAIALAIASERKGWQVTGCDRITEAVQLAAHNQRKNHVENARFLVSHWFSALGEQAFDVIVTNPPYVESDSAYLTQGDLRFEPGSALTSGEDGLDDIRLIIPQARQHLKSDGWLLIEHGFKQANAIQELFADAGYEQIQTRQDCAGHDRVTFAQFKLHNPL
ncbi:peptide chain release factor N(5)-glutamine methyltransferase [Planctobacterium marinum]|uniref:peptide chain release factor N(5)-glutamine methyltransferase n=1 Tax=Planctobacterium marinum TaxID=1631968 RepID=UPI001E2B8784|nr:peptide chain release factor N(5)-glutamine methyltransferase [Planctobacterium marinum]MCC2604324.1 peptide chain release factor N(5)-glutamine methyltransferase [Planctobacterium marinum]